MSNHDPKSPEHLAHEVEQEVETIHVPRGKSRARYVMTIGLLVFILVIFVVSDLFQGMFARRGGSGPEGPFMEWNHPRLGTRSVGARDFVLERRRVEDFYRVLGVDRRQLRDLTSDDNIARTLILDELAQEAGVEFTDSELRALIKERFTDAATYKQILEAVRVTPTDFQEVLRRMMRVQRYEQSLAELVAQPDAAEIEKNWKEQHKQHSLEVVTFPASSDDPEVALNLPDDAGFAAWYDGLDATRKRQLFAAQWKPERAAAELAYFAFEGGDATALIARYPRPEGTDLDQLARDFHSQFAHLRFRRPEEKTDAADARERLYFTFDEVADRARVEAQAHAAMLDWSNDLRSRIAAGTEVDLAGEAVALGVAYSREATPKSQLEWSAAPELGGPVLSDSVMRASRGDRFISAMVTEKQIVLGRVIERLEAGAPPYSEVADAVIVEWRKDKAQELARARAGKLVEACKPPIVEGVQSQPIADAETFAVKAAELGAAVESTGWIDQSKLPVDVAPEEGHLQHFLRELKLGARSALTSIPDAVMGPYTSTDKTRVFVARYIGSRDAPEVRIEPREFRGLEANALRDSQQKVSENLFGKAGLELNFGLRFPGRTESEEGIPPEGVDVPVEEQG